LGVLTFNPLPVMFFNNKMKNYRLTNDSQKFILLEKIVWAAFSQRRKMLRNTLKGFRFDQKVVEEINFERRPETLTIQEFVKLLK